MTSTHKIQDRLRTVHRPLKVLTFHAKDVYPQLLRSTILVRLVAAYEAYLVDTIEEISKRSVAPFENDKRIEITQRQLLDLDRHRMIKSHIVGKTTRQLTSGGLEEIRKFYTGALGVDIPSDGVSLKEIEEIHERRHLYVHRAGYADEQYVHKYPSSNVSIDELVPVTEAYLLRVIDVLSWSALHIKRTIEAKYAEPESWKYRNGTQTVAESLEQLVVVNAIVSKYEQISPLLDLTAELENEETVSSVIVWVATKGTHVRWLIGGSSKEVTSFFRLLAIYEDAGQVSNIDSFKVKRDRS